MALRMTVENQAAAASAPVTLSWRQSKHYLRSNHFTNMHIPTQAEAVPLGCPIHSYRLAGIITSPGCGFQHVSTIPKSPSRTGWSSRQGLRLSSAPLALLPHAKVPDAVHFWSICDSTLCCKTLRSREAKDVNSGQSLMFNNQQLWGKLAKSPIPDPETRI